MQPGVSVPISNRPSFRRPSSRWTSLFVACSGLALLLCGCSGGSAAVGTANFSCTGASKKALCLHNCSLGCSSSGCLRTDIAQNEIVVLQFSDDVDPATVNTSTIRLRTASGELPVGEFFVNGNQVEFVPTLLISGGQSFFGFRPGEVYTMTLPGGLDEPNSVRSTSGFVFRETLSCTLTANLGIQDLNGVPPSATLVVPTSSQLAAAPLDTLIQVEFNEMVDATPFLAAPGASGPVTFAVRRTRAAAGGGRECDLNSAPVGLPGTARLDFDPARGISVLTFRPAANLPANVCIEINITSAVVDLSGKPAQPQAFSFLTIQVPLSETSITENFDDDTNLDRDRSAGTWAGGFASFARIGGDGRHGTFALELGVDQGIIAGKRTFLFNTNSTIIPAENTITGSPIAVTDGKYFFDKMLVPGDVRLRFTGSNPPVFTVAGRLDIQGEIDIAGQSWTTMPVSTALQGQVGGAGGIFGGNGGTGGDKNTGSANPAFNGRHGQDARVVGGRAYATSATGSGGRGSTIFPANGLATSLLFNFPAGTAGTPPIGQISYSPSAPAGGAGGGFFTAGEPGVVVSNNHPVSWTLVPPSTYVPNVPPPRLEAMGPPSVAGAAVQFFPFPAASGSTLSSLHFLVGGSGGGGAASNGALSLKIGAQVAQPQWVVGGGGGGGGGAIGLRAGDSLSLGPLGRVLANGGSAASGSGPSSGPQPMPGGGGSGGAVVLQSGRQVDLSGVIDVRPGAGGVYNRSATGVPPAGVPAGVPFSASVQVAGGAGSKGFVRAELPGNPTIALLANVLPAPAAGNADNNVATLTETDPFVSTRSSFYSTGLVFGPEYARYEIHAVVDGVPIVYSDDPAVSTVPAQVGAAVRVFFQAANLNVTSGQVLEVRPWRTSVISTSLVTGIASDGLNGFRFLLIVDRGIAQQVTIDKVVVIYRV